MSRTRRQEAHVIFGSVYLMCPNGHRVAEVAVQNGRMLCQGSFRHPDSPLDYPLAVICHDCERVGKRDDLRGSWKKVAEKASELADDTRAASTEYVLGGQA